MRYLISFVVLMFAGGVLATETHLVAPGESLVKARNAARVWHSSNPGETFIIHLKSGTHQLLNPLLLDSTDSHTRWMG